MGKKTFAVMMLATGVFIGVLLTVGTGYFVWRRCLSPQGMMSRSITNHMASRLQKAE